MCSLAFSRVFRCLVCLLLVCCVLVNISPIRTYAVATVSTATLVGISTLSAVLGILACLGIAQVGSTGFEETCQQIADAIPPNFLITVNKKSMVSAMRIKDTVYVPEDLIRHVAAHIPTIYTVSDSFPLPDEVAPYMQLMVNCADYSSHISDDVSYYSRLTCFRYMNTTEETIAYVTEPVYIDVIQDTGSALVNAYLFGSFLLCGTLVGIFLLRGRYGT